MARIFFTLIATILLLPTSALAEPLQLCVKADRFVEGRPREGTKIVLRSQCKVRSNGTPIEISLGTTDALGGGEAEVSPSEFEELKLALLVHGCGDGRLDPLSGEQCDDDGTDPGDGCSTQCQVEEGWSCEGRASDCATVCGDGVIAGSEVCDDGDTTGGDGCSADCLSDESCGNGVFDGEQLGEQCDDGNTESGDGCSPLCQVELGFYCETPCNQMMEVGVCGGSEPDYDQCLASCIEALSGPCHVDYWEVIQCVGDQGFECEEDEEIRPVNNCDEENNSWASCEENAG